MDKNLIPPKKASDNAKLGLKLRQKYHRGGLSLAKANSLNIDSGITRAKQLTSGKPLTIEIIKKMARFNRHRRNFRPEIKLKDGGPTAGTIAWLLWGGDEGINWAINFKNKF
ncbi:MAG: hypothetical protein K6F04_00370 [bacterium]|nr:hypothetical protein [bacterium]